MKKINSLVECYNTRLEQFVLQNNDLTIQLKKKIELSNSLIQKLRLEVRENSFTNKETEIKFFKQIKPKIFAKLKLYCSQLDYLVEKPNSTICDQIDFIKTELQKLEKIKIKNIIFYRYYKHSETILDTTFFTRINNRLDISSPHISLSLDPQFNTSHDLLAAEVLTYDMLTEFYKKELIYLQSNGEDCSKYSSFKNTSKKLNWTASKTDLIELIYALKISGAIANGDTKLKEMIDIFSEIFSVDLGNYYKTYSEIRNRTNNQTKFLNKLIKSLLNKMEIDEI